MRFVWLLGLLGLLLLCCVVSVSADKEYSFDDISTPVNCSAVAISGGSLDANTTYYYIVIGVKYVGTLEGFNYYWYGKSKASDEFSATTTDVNKSIQIQFNMPVGEAGSYRIFRMTSSGQYINERILPLKYSPDDATYNVGGTVTFNDTGYVTLGNQYLETTNNAHGVLTLSGSTSGDKFSIEDLYQADITNGWGVIDKLGHHTYRVNCYLKTHTDLYWYDEDVTIIFADGIGGYTSTNFEFGKIAGEKTERGCNIRFENTWLCSISFGTLNAYRSTFTYSYPFYSRRLSLVFINFNAGLIQDCFVNKIRSFTPNSLADCTLKNVVLHDYDIAFGAGKAVFENVRCLGGSRVYQLSGTQNVRGKDLYVVGNILFAISASGYLELVNTVYDYFTSTGDCTGFRLYDKISYNVNVVDSVGNPIEDANVSMYDKDDVLLFSVETDSNGDIEEQEITRVLTTMVGTVKTTVSKSPFKLVVNKEGNGTYIEYVSYDTSVGVVKTVALNTSGVGGFRGYVVEYNDLSSVVLPVWFFLSVIGFIIYDRRKK